MKAGKLLFILALMMGVITFTSCKKDNDTVNDVTGSGSMSLTYNGTSWTADLAVQGVNTNGVVNVTGSDANGHQASVILYGVTELGTYEIVQTLQHQLRWTEGVNTEQTFVANGILGSGSISVTELSSTKVKGTFSFTGYNTSGDSRSITNGEFEASF